MKTGELSIDDLVAAKVKEELSKYQGCYRRISDEWIKLRKEINDYIRNDMKTLTGMSYTTCQNSIYTPIRIILGVSRIDEINDDQAKIARDVFYYVKCMVERHNQKNKEETK